MDLPSEQELKFYDRHKVARPTHEEHGLSDTFENPLSESLISGNARNWRMEGNELIADTDFGPIRQFIDTNYILTGTDAKGLPVFKKVV